MVAQTIQRQCLVLVASSVKESVEEGRMNDVFHTFLCSVDDDDADEKDKQGCAIMFALVGPVFEPERDRQPT